MTVLLKLITTWLVAFVLWFVLTALVAIPTVFVWNWTVPEILGLPRIGFSQAFGLLVLSSLLFSTRKVDVKMQE